MNRPGHLPAPKEAILYRLAVPPVRKAACIPTLHPRQCQALIEWCSSIIGVVAELHQAPVVACRARQAEQPLRTFWPRHSNMGMGRGAKARTTRER
eukprot:358961-Chlamydomonas_euryale.AAC.17